MADSAGAVRLQQVLCVSLGSFGCTRVRGRESGGGTRNCAFAPLNPVCCRFRLPLLLAGPQEMLRAQMALAYKTGDVDKAHRLQSRLQPDELKKK